MKLNFISQPFNIWAGGLGKISVAFLLLRVMARKKTREWFLYGVIATLVILNAISVGIIFGQCNPPRKLWEPYMRGHCLSTSVQTNLGFFQAPYSAFIDLLLALFPLPIIWNLQMTSSNKLGLASAMSLGVFAAGAGAAKAYELRLLSARADYTYDTVDLIFWYSTEMYVVIIAACIPPLRPLLPLCRGMVSRKRMSGHEGSYSRGIDRDRKLPRAPIDEEGHPLNIVPASASYSHSNPVIDDLSTMQLPNNVQLGSQSRASPEPHQIWKTTEVDISTLRDGYNYANPSCQ